MKRVSGAWGAAAAWNKTTGDLSGVACVYSGDWDLVLSGQDTAGNYKVWSLIYGDGGDVPAGTWSSLKEIAAAPASGQFTYSRPYLNKPDVYRYFFVESFTGSEAYNRPFWSHSVLDSKFSESLWREAVPFDLSSGYGLALAHSGGYCWLSSPSGVWRAGMTPQSFDISADVIFLKAEAEKDEGSLIAGLRNDSGQYASPGGGSLALLQTGCQLDLSPGYRTSAGNEVSAGQTFSLESYEHTSAGGKATLVLYARDGWGVLRTWCARHQSRWNKSSSETNVRDILAFVLARAGLRLEVKSASAELTGFYPDFTISPGDSGEQIISKLLSFVPDVLFVEGYKAYVLNPQSTDASQYSYGGDHAILEGSYRKADWELNRVQVEGFDTGAGTIISADSFAWSEVSRVYDRLKRVEDRNIGSVAAAQSRGQAYLRRAEIGAGGGFIIVPVNCGQQPYDVIDVTDSRAGLSAQKKRVLGLVLSYNPARGEYRQKLILGGV